MGWIGSGYGVMGWEAEFESVDCKGREFWKHVATA